MIAAMERFIGAAVRKMVRRSVRARFHSVHWIPQAGISRPAVFYANHHGWMDGYLMHHLAARLGHDDLYWIEQYDAFPLFRTGGGLPYRVGDVAGRAATIRQTIRLLRQGKSLMLFPEGVMHPPGDVLPFGRAMQVLAKHVRDLVFVPVGIRYEMAMHERPEAWLQVGEPHRFDSLELCRSRIQSMLGAPLRRSEYQLLAAGTKDVNERWGFNKTKEDRA